MLTWISSLLSMNIDNFLEIKILFLKSMKVNLISELNFFIYMFNNKNSNLRFYTLKFKCAYFVRKTLWPYRTCNIQTYLRYVLNLLFINILYIRFWYFGNVNIYYKILLDEKGHWMSIKNIFILKTFCPYQPLLKFLGNFCPCLNYKACPLLWLY